MKFSDINRKKENPKDLTMARILSNGNISFFGPRLNFFPSFIVSSSLLLFCNVSSFSHYGKRFKKITKPIKKSILKNYNRKEVNEGKFGKKTAKLLKIYFTSFSNKNIKFWVLEITETIDYENTIKFLIRVFKSRFTGFFLKKKTRIFFRIKI